MLLVHDASPNRATNEVIAESLSCAERCVQGRFSCVGERSIHVGAAFNQKLAEPPVPVEACAIQIELVSQRSERFAFGEQEFYGAYITVIRAPFDQRDPIRIVSATVRNLLKHRHRWPIYDAGA